MSYNEPFRNYNFKLLSQNEPEAHFCSISGLAAKVETIRFREGGDGPVVRQCAGRVHYEPIKLRYGLSSSRDLFDWVMASVSGRVQRKDVSIVICDNDGVTELMRYDLYNAWACEWQAANLDALGQEMAIDCLTLTFEHLRLSTQ